MPEVTGLFLQVKIVVERACKNNQFWHSDNIYEHSLRTAEIAKREAEERGQDGEIAWLAGALHDIGSALYGRDNHHYTGAEEAKKILRGFGYPEEKVAQVARCIFAHRSSIAIKRNEIEQCVADADALAHFEEIPGLIEAILRLAGRNGLSLSIGEARKLVREKIEKDWEKLSPRMKLRARKTYFSALKEIEEFGYDEP